MPTESTRKRLALDHCHRVNAGDLDGLLALYSADVRFEDPVGAGERTGHRAFRLHAGAAIAARCYEEAGHPVAAQDGVHAAVPVIATMDYLPNGPALARHGLIAPPVDPGRAGMRFRYLMVIGVGPDELINTMRAFWGASDITVLPSR